MPEETRGVPDRIVVLIGGRVTSLKNRLEREVKALVACKHGYQADQCDQCKGMTALGAPIGAVLDVLKREGLITVELAMEQPIRYRRHLKTLVGVGIGVSFFIGFAGWQGGKLLWRLVKRDANPAGHKRA